MVNPSFGDPVTGQTISRVDGSDPSFTSMPYVEWQAAFAGVVVALAVDFVLLTFGSAVGLSAVSPWTSTRTTVSAVSYGAAFWMILVNIWAFGIGGYLAARMRHRRAGVGQTEVEFRDGAHGAIVWGSALTLAAIVAALIATSVARTGSQSNTSNDPATMATDTLLRTTRPVADARPEDVRGEVGRLLVGSLGAQGLLAADRTYLAQLVSARTALPAADAEKRVDDTVVRFKDATNRARKTGIIVAFITAATLLLGAAAAWWGAVVGGKHRDEGTVWHGLGGHTPFSSLWSK